jgi:hypothetical protein
MLFLVLVISDDSLLFMIDELYTCITTCIREFNFDLEDHWG